MNRLFPVLSAGLLIAACQQVPNSAGPGDAPAAAATMPSDKALTLWYTHDGAEKLYRSAKYNETEDLCRQAVEQIEKVRGSNSPALAAPLNDLATVYMRQARFADAKAVMDRAEAVLDADKPDQALLLARLGINKGWRLYVLGEPAAAQKVFEESRDLIEKNQKGDSLDRAEIVNNLALMYEETAEENEDESQIDQSRRLLIQAWQMRRKLAGDESPETAESLNNLGIHLLFNAKNDTDTELGLSTLKKALAVAAKVYGPNNPETATAHASMALGYFLTREFDAAEKEIRISLPITARTLGSMHPDRAEELATLGRILVEQTDYDDAEKAFAEAVTIDEHVFGKTHPNVISALNNLKSVYDAKGDQAKSDQIQKRIEKLSGKEI